MTEVMIVSGFLGAGKTTFINRFLEYGLAGTRCLLIEMIWRYRRGCSAHGADEKAW